MSRVRPFLARLARDRRGAAAVEFALLSTFLFVVLLAALDFALYAQQKARLGQAVEQGAMIAFSARSSAPTVDTTSIANYLAAAGGTAVATGFQCNGQTVCTAANSAQSRCIGAPATAGGWPTFSTALASGLCASGGTPGYYLVIRATRTFAAVVVPNRFLAGSTMQQQVAVRLQ